MRYYLLLATAIGTVIIIICGLNMGGSSYTEYVITETIRYSSLDPIDADKSHNLPIARLIYLTPIEFSTENKMVSAILSKFSFDSGTKTISFTLNPNLTFSNGQKIQIDDLQIAITRMAFFRPKFPVIKHIQGLEAWLNTATPLRSTPSGITKNGNTLEIKLTKSVMHPLTRFGLELFSIIPKDCINLDTGMLSCDDIPSSGYYTLHQETDPNRLTFNMRLDPVKFHNNTGPQKITVSYSKLDKPFLQKIKTGSIVSGLESDLLNFNKNDLEDLNEYKLKYLSSSRFMLFRFSTLKPPFDNQKCRLFFSEKLRDTFLKINVDSNIERSIFTQVTPGYQANSELKKMYNLSAVDEQYCLKLLRKTGINFSSSASPSLTFGFETILRTCKEMNIPVHQNKNSLTPEELTDKFITGEVSIVPGASGFWPEDPVGDIQMYFTPGLHKTLKFLWNDEILQNKLSELDNLTDNKIGSKLNEINEYLYLDSKVSVFTHLKRFIIVPKNYRNFSLQSVTSNAIWQF